MANYLRTMMLISSVMCLWSPTSEAQLVDPTRPPEVMPTIKLGTFELSAISFSDTNKFAVINDHIVHIGDEFDNVKVINIEPNTVELEGASGKFSLSLLNSPKR